MDIQHLVDRLEDLIDEGRHIPMTKTTMIDEERALEIIDQMRISVPEEIERASRVINQRDRVLAQANEEAARIVDLAKEKSDTLIQRDAVVQAAQNRAANIIEQARQDAEAIRTEADQYVLEVLNELEAHLIKTLTVVRNGINKIMQDHEASRERAEIAAQQAQQEAETPQPTSQQATVPTVAPAAPASTPAPVIPKPVEVTLDAPSD